MPLTVLSGSDVRTVLHSLTSEDIRNLQQSLADALHYYSTSTEDDKNGCCSSYQPLRTAIKRNDGLTSLFMPASSNDGLGVKLVTLSVPDSDSNSISSSQTKATTTSSSDGASLASLSSPESLSISSAAKPSEPSKSPAEFQSDTTPKGSLTLLDKTGAARAFINAEEITAFRTALASTMLFNKRHNVHDVVVFGAGKQAYWHIRLALLLRGADIRHLTIINRSFDRAGELIRKLYSGSGASHALPRPKIQIITPSANEYDRLLKSTLRASSVIFFTTPSTEPLFPASILTNAEGRKKGRYLAAIGSYKPHMVEIHPDIIRQNVAPDHHKHHKHVRQGGAIIVDSVEACMQEAGEVIQAGLSAREVVEIGELIMLKKDAEMRRGDAKQREASGMSEEEKLDLATGGVELGEAKKAKWKLKRHVERKEEKDGDEAHQRLVEWLNKGNVIYKSVGLGLMDVVVGADLVKLADERGVGVRIENF